MAKEIKAKKKKKTTIQILATGEMSNKMTTEQNCGETMGILKSNASFVDELISEKCFYAFVERENRDNVLHRLK